MFTREEVNSALAATKLSTNEEFKKFMVEVGRVNIHTVYAQEAIDHITQLIYSDEFFDSCISHMIVLYNELVQTHRQSTGLAMIYTAIYKSDILQDCAGVCCKRMDYVDTKDYPVYMQGDVVYQLIVLLIMYTK